MNKDYSTENQRKAYTEGISARISGLKEENNPYMPIEGLGYCIEHFCWLNGYNETGSIKKHVFITKGINSER